VCGHLTLAQAVEDPSLSDEISLQREIVGRYPPGRAIFYASGFPYALIRVVLLPICGETGSLCAAEIISHLGGRPEVDLSQLLADAGGLMIARPAVRG
jgi:hypothetical protein